MTTVHAEVGHHIGRHLPAHSHPHPHVHHNYGPSYEGTVVLDIGADVGALVIFTGAGHLGREIEISPAGSTANTRTHVAVRERHVDQRTLYCAVYPGLTAGLYTVWRDEDTPIASVRITGAEITQFTWPASQT